MTGRDAGDGGMIGWRDARREAGSEERKLGALGSIFSHYYFRRPFLNLSFPSSLRFWCAMSNIDGVQFRQETQEFV